MHFARARNLDGLNKAIEEKLKAQRDSNPEERP